MRAELCPFAPGDEAAWDAYVRRAPTAGHCHLSGWRRVVARSYGHRPLYLWVLGPAGVAGVLPLILFRGLGGRHALVSMPFLDDGGVVADSDEVARALGRAALGLGRRCGAAALELRHRRPGALALPAHGGKVTLALALAGDPRRMWAGFDPKLRNQVRKAQKSGLEVGWTGPDGLADFYRVFARNMRDLGSPVHGRRFFGAVLEEFGDGARLAIVRRAGRAIAGGLCLAFRDTLLMPWASSLRTERWACPSTLLYWEAIRWACEKGFVRFDFGRSSPGSGPYRFKRQWGAAVEPLHWQRSAIVRPAPRSGAAAAGPAADVASRAAGVAAEPTRPDRPGPLARAAVAAWRRLPVALATRLGPVLRGRLSQ
ncbi:MAG TPA: FemAB family XrtA/PEP-CTERM system-associated protein [Methylomirabilota bacterium]|nr:FemAB family XrtA/PEP-CTERM system-associated protein [Methylomirabilota bacterium]